MTSDKTKTTSPKVNARVSEEEYELIQALSQSENTTPSDYVRKALRLKMVDDILSITKVKMTDGSPIEIREALNQLLKGEDKLKLQTREAFS